METEHLKSTKPSVVMVVMGYNQQDSIGYAIDSALLQDYDGSMTIVLSDDCSSDSTFDVMRKKADAYQGGFRLILNRNEANLGYAGNLLKAMRLADFGKASSKGMRCRSVDQRTDCRSMNECVIINRHIPTCLVNIGMWTLKYLHDWDLRYKKQPAYCAYHHRSYASNVIHWLRQKETPISCLSPIPSRGIIRRLKAKISAS